VAHPLADLREQRRAELDEAARREPDWEYAPAIQLKVWVSFLRDDLKTAVEALDSEDMEGFRWAMDAVIWEASNASYLSECPDRMGEKQAVADMVADLIARIERGEIASNVEP